ncbi:hypothetical protein AtNW77_Chr2g0230881 [Arabidopsis thaliana]
MLLITWLDDAFTLSRTWKLKQMGWCNAGSHSECVVCLKLFDNSVLKGLPQITCLPLGLLKVYINYFDGPLGLCLSVLKAKFLMLYDVLTGTNYEDQLHITKVTSWRGKEAFRFFFGNNTNEAREK